MGRVEGDPCAIWRCLAEFRWRSQIYRPCMPRAGFSRERLCKSCPLEIKGVGEQPSSPRINLKTRSLCWWEWRGKFCTLEAHSYITEVSRLNHRIYPQHNACLLKLKSKNHICQWHRSLGKARTNCRVERFASFAQRTKQASVQYHPLNTWGRAQVSRVPGNVTPSFICMNCLDWMLGF